MEILMSYSVNPNFDVDFAVQVALLHDVLEDTDTSYEELNHCNTYLAERIHSKIVMYNMLYK